MPPVASGHQSDFCIISYFSRLTIYATWKDENETVVNSNGIADSLTAGTYQFHLEDANGCTAISTPIMVTNETVDYITPVYKNVTIPRNTSATLSVSNFQTGTYSLYDNPSLINSIRQNTTGVFITGVISQDKTFYITLSAGNCSSITAEVHIKVADATKFFVPGAFTPNADGLNDVIKPVVQGLFSLESFTIYDRFGNQVFKTTDIAKGWKGDKNGLLLDTGTYIWVIKGKDIYDKPLVMKGTVVLIH